MKTSNSYLYFDGRCRDAMSFYGAVFGGQPSFTTFGDMPPDIETTASPEQIMHSELHIQGMVLMAGDAPPEMAWRLGNNVTISLTCESIDEMDRLFAALSEGGQVTTPVYDAFWGDRIGLLRDRFGVNWMLSYR